MKVTKIRVGLGNTCGPSFQPMKVYVEFEAEVEDISEDAPRLRRLVAAEVYNYCLEQLFMLKGAEEASKFRKEG